MTTIAFIGLGNMGGGMAANLAAAGHNVQAFDLSDAALKAAKKAGCTPVSSVKAAVKDAETVVTMLPAGQHVRAVYTGDDGILIHAERGAILMDCSTIDVDSARDVTAAAAQAGFEMVDAPVSGGVAAAAGGTLTFMVGGTEAAFDAAKPYLDIMGKAVIHAGASGNGQVAKVCNNMLLGISMIGTCEAFIMAEKLGLDAQTFFDISSQASGQNWSMTSYCPAPGPVPSAPSNKGYKPGFAAGMMLKDLRLASEAAKKAKTAIPLGAHAEALYTLMEASGHDDLDFSAVYKMLEGKL